MGFGRKEMKMLALAAMFAAGQAPFAAAACDPATVELRGDWGKARFHVEIADDAGERAQGLMFREKLGSSAGMLFVYPRPQRVAFWMQNTLIPLDMIFVNEHGVVTRVHDNAIPHDTTSIPGGDDVMVVLEINGGLAKALGIVPGSQLRNPVFAAHDPAWGCDGP